MCNTSAIRVRSLSSTLPMLGCLASTLGLRSDAVTPDALFLYAPRPVRLVRRIVGTLPVHAAACERGTHSTANTTATATTMQTTPLSVANPEAPKIIPANTEPTDAESDVAALNNPKLSQ